MKSKTLFTTITVAVVFFILEYLQTENTESYLYFIYIKYI